MFVLARKPLVGTVAENVLTWGTGALNIDGCRVDAGVDSLNGGAYAKSSVGRHDGTENWRFKAGFAGEFQQPDGRWPPNVLLSEEVADYLSVSNPHTKSGKVAEDKSGYVSSGNSVFIRGVSTQQNQHGDEGSVARFYPQFTYEEFELNMTTDLIILARKPFTGTVAENVLAYGTGTLNIDGCRIAINPEVDDPRLGGRGTWSGSGKRHSDFAMGDKPLTSSELGRWPPNVLLETSSEILAEFPHTASGQPSGLRQSGNHIYSGQWGKGVPLTGYGDEGSAARFFPQFTYEEFELNMATDLIVLARKPLVGTVAENVLSHGVGAINVDACRVDADTGYHSTRGAVHTIPRESLSVTNAFGAAGIIHAEPHEGGRWPPNVLLETSSEILAEFPHTVSGQPSGLRNAGNNIYGLYTPGTILTGYGDEGSAARFFPQFTTLEETMFLEDAETPAETPKEIKLNGYLYAGDNLEYLRTLPDNSIDSIVTDPPYGLGKEPDPRKVLAAWLNDEVYQPGGRGFMGKEWDAFVPSPVLWQECLRVLKPGGHMIAFAGTRTYDWVVMGVRLAGFEIRDSIAWLYGSGFPKSLNVSKAIDAKFDATREIVGETKGAYSSNTESLGVFNSNYAITAPATPEAQQWEGWGTALKPALEPAVLARKPLVGTVAENVLTHGTGALNIEAARVEGKPRTTHKDGNYTGNAGYKGGWRAVENDVPEGRWPANVVHDGSEVVTSEFPDANGMSGGGVRKVTSDILPSIQTNKETNKETDNSHLHRKDAGSAARFFTQASPDPIDGPLFRYCAKSSTSERNMGTDAIQEAMEGKGNIHSTVKPLSLMEWLVKLITPPGGVVLDPFLGSGTTAMAAELLGFQWIGCERETDYAMIANQRISYVAENREEILAKREKAKAEKPAKAPKSAEPVESVESDDGFFF